MRRLQQLLHRWSDLVFGDRAKEITPHIRALRLLEEVLELCQADDVLVSEIHTIIDQVYSKPAGYRAEELGGVIICVVAYADIAGWDLEDIFYDEFCRIMDPVIMEKVRRRNLAGDKIGFIKPASVPSRLLVKCPGCDEIVLADAVHYCQPRKSVPHDEHGWKPD